MELLVEIVRDPRTGAAVILAVMWWFKRQDWLQERTERKEVQAECSELRERTLKALADATVSVQQAAGGVNSVAASVNALKDALITRRWPDNG